MAEKNLTGYPSIDKPWLKYYSEGADKAAIPQCTIYENIYDNNKDYLNETAMLFFGKKISYGKLFEEVDKAAKAFLSYGVKCGDSVAMCVPAVPEAMYSILALNKIGANANMLNPTFTEAQLVDRINDADISVLVVVNELYERIEKVIPQTKIKTVISCAAVNSLGSVVKLIKKAKNIPNTIPWNQFIKHGKDTKLVPCQYKKDMPAIMVYSSGTTGASKSIQLTNDSINATITDGGKIGFEWKRQDRYFSQIPIWFSTGICATMLVPLRYGITIILEPMYDFEIFYKHIIKYRPNFMITAAGLLDYLMTEQEYSDAYKEFRYLVIGGEYVTPRAERKFNEWLNKNGNSYGLHKGYGMCECGGTVTATSMKCNSVGSAGIPTPHAIVSAFDLETGKELKYGERGEVRVLTPCRMLGYHKNKEATDKYFHTDEKGNVWACTGDMGYVTEDGSVYVSGRLSNSYVTESGERIYLFDIERTVLDVEGVRQCKVVVSKINNVETHVIHISLDKNARVEDVIRNIEDYCKKNLKDTWRPTLYRLYESSLPVAPSGKLDVIKMEKDVEALKRL